MERVAALPRLPPLPGAPSLVFATGVADFYNDYLNDVVTLDGHTAPDPDAREALADPVVLFPFSMTVSPPFWFVLSQVNSFYNRIILFFVWFIKGPDNLEFAG